MHALHAFHAPHALAAACAAALLCAAPAQARDLATCRALADSAARLACYDALPLPGATAPPPPAAARPVAMAPVAAPVVAAVAAPVPAQAAPPAAAPSPANFGREGRETPQTLSSTIPGLFEGWGPRTRIRLANGQVWQVIDGSEGVYALTDAPVTVRRAALGGFVMEIQGANKAPRVRRVE